MTINLSDMPVTDILRAQRNILGEIRRQYDQEGAISLAVLDQDGYPVVVLPFMAADHPGIGAMLSKAESNLHDRLTAAGVNIDEPLYEEHDDEFEPAPNGQAGTAPKTIQ